MNTQHDITVSGKPLNPPKPPAKPHMLLWIDTETTGISRTNPVIELIRRLRKATHRPEPANDPTICAICGAPLTDSTSSICPDCRELEKDW